jgi:hypothetical protein
MIEESKEEDEDNEEEDELPAKRNHQLKITGFVNRDQV